jgi:hypothetical protein
MSDLVERLRFGGNNKSEATRHEAADRIEALEKHKRLQMEDVMNLGAALGQARVRIEQLEAALREIAKNDGDVFGDLARNAIAPERDK